MMTQMRKLASTQVVYHQRPRSKDHGVKREEGLSPVEFLLPMLGEAGSSSVSYVRDPLEHQPS